ncbi:MAG: DUF6273 domain-containing protein [Eubacteriaceae bacterium]|nr:DUF6273 domain-containing protein [Eubacteriaceae bacterium]
MKMQRIGIVALCFIFLFSTVMFNGGYLGKADNAKAETKTEVKAGAGASGEFVKGGDANGPDYLYYGNYKGEPIKWRVLDNQMNGTFKSSQEGLFLMSEYAMGKSIFNSDSANRNWAGSQLESYMEGLYDKGSKDEEGNYLPLFSETEKAEIPAVSKTETGIVNFNTSTTEYVCEPSGLSENHLFTLSALEATDSDYGFSSGANTTDTKRCLYISEKDKTGCFWHTRSLVKTNDSLNWMAVADGTNGNITRGGASWESAYARPAMNVSTNNVLMTTAATAADGGKQAGDSLNKVKDIETGTAKKLTLITDSQKLSSVKITDGMIDASGAEDSYMKVSYIGATTGKNEYLSAAIYGTEGTDNGKLLYYGNIKNLSDSSSSEGTAKIDLPAGFDSSKMKVSVFTECLNGDKQTDYAGKPVELSTESEITLKQDYEIQGLSVNVVNVNKVPAGKTIEISGMALKEEYKESKKIDLEVTGRDNGEIVPITRVVGKSNTYQFTMPLFNVKVYAAAVEKGTRMVRGDLVEADMSKYVKSTTLNTTRVHTGDKVKYKINMSNARHYAESVSVYTTDFVLDPGDDPTGGTSIKEQANVFDKNTTNKYTFKDSDNGEVEFTVPDGSRDILIEANIKDVEKYKVIIAGDIDDLGIENDGFEKKSGIMGIGDRYEASYYPGQNVVLNLKSTMPYKGFDFDVIEPGGNAPAPAPEVNTADINDQGQFSSKYDFQLPEFSMGQNNGGTYTIKLKSKDLFHKYDVSSATPDASSISDDDLSKITVQGERLGQIFGDDGLDLLEDETQKGSIQKITFGTSEDPSKNEEIKLDENSMLSSDHKTITVPLSKELIKKIREADRSHEVSAYYLTVGTDAVEVELPYDKKMRSEEFGILAVMTKDKTHSIFLADSDDQITEEATASGKKVLFTAQGKVKYDKATKRYYFKKGENIIDGTVTCINTGDNEMYFTEDNGTVKLSASKCVLSIPGTTFFKRLTPKNDVMHMELAKGETYTTKNVMDEKDTDKNISMEWNMNDAEGLKGMEQSWFTAEFNGVTLLDGKVAFKGEMSLKEPTSVVTTAPFSADFDELVYRISDGKASFDGMKVDAQATAGGNIIPCVSMKGGTCELGINTYEDIYKVAAEVNLGVIEGNGKLELKKLPDGLIAPNTLEALIAGDKGVPIIPEVLEVTGGGGGFSGLVDTIGGNWEVLPPITVNGQTRLTSCEILNMDAKFTTGLTELSFSGKPWLGKDAWQFSPFKDLSMGVYATDNEMTARGNSSVQIVEGFDVLDGNSSFMIGYNWKDKKDIISGEVDGSLQIPKIKVHNLHFGPYNVASTSAGISKEAVHGTVCILGFIDVGYTYKWQDKTVSFGGSSNAKLIGSSDSSLPVSTDNVVSDVNEKASIVEVKDVPDGSIATAMGTRNDLLVEYYDEDEKDFVKYSPAYPRTEPAAEGTPYTLDELTQSGVNAFDTTEDGGTVNVALDTDLSTRWKITSKSGKKVDWDIAQFEPQESIADTSISSDTVKYDLEDLDDSNDYTLKSYLKGTNEKAGILLDSKEINSSDISDDGDASGTMKTDLDFDSNMPSGEYDVELHLISKDGSKTSSGSITHDVEKLNDTVTYTNPIMPEKVSDVKVKNNGDETLNVSFTGSENSKGDKADYEILFYDEDMEPVHRQNDIALADDDGNMTDQTQMTYCVDSSLSKNGEYNVNVSGLTPGRKYIAKVVPYTGFDPSGDGKETVYPVKGGSAVSGTDESTAVELTRSDAPDVAMSVENGKTVKDGSDSMNIYTSGDYTVNVSSDEACKFILYKNDEMIDRTEKGAKTASFDLTQKTEGSTDNISVEAVDSDGSKGRINSTVYKDDTAPPLYVEHNDAGKVVGAMSGAYTIVGHTESGAKACLAGDENETVTADENGAFKFKGNIPSGEKQLFKTVSVTDAAGNTETASVYVTRGANITATAGKGGHVKGSGTYEKNDTVTLTAVPSKGYRFVKWTEGLSKVSSSYRYTFKAEQDRNVKAVFAKIKKTKIKAYGIGKYRNKVKWKKVSGTYKYEIYRRPMTKKKYKKIATVKNSRKSYIDKKTKKWYKYYYKVRVVCKAGKKVTKGKFSKVKSVRAKKYVK